MTMTQLVALNSESHRDCRVSEDAALRFAATQNVMQLQVTEIGQAVCSFPVFLTRGPGSGSWLLSAVLSLEQGDNLFVEGHEWTAAYLPFGLQTYPLFLMQSPDEEKGYAVGVIGHDEVLSRDKGELLYDAEGNESTYLKNVTRLLEAGLENEIQTRHFAQRLEQLGLVKSIDVCVHYGDEAVQKITGLHTIDEEKLRSMAAETLAELNSNGYLLLINAMLVSVFQLNTLIRRHNKDPGRRPIKEARFEVAGTTSAADIASQ